VQTNPDNSISSRPPASHPVHHNTPEIISSEACSVPLPESVGLFFEKYQKAEFYKDLKRRIKERNEEETLERLSGDGQTRPMTVPLSPNQTALWTAAPPGCQSHLLQPPFLLDASFETDPRRSPFPEITSLLTALTTAKAGDSFDLERLETIGDSFLKMTTCLYLHQKYPAYHEGRLSFLKDQQISNYNLYRLGKELGLPAFVINQVLEPLVNFTPPGYKALGERGLVELNDKGLADVLEAIIGMILMECGSASALTLMTSLGLKVELEKGFSGEKSPLLRNDPGVKEELRHLTAGFDAFEEHIGYKYVEHG
jgi:Ribonuclease III domain